MKRAAAILILCLGLMTVSSYSQGQQAMSADSHVRFDFTVMDKKSWRFVDGLKKEDFSIYEDGVKQEVIDVSRSERPLSIVLLVDLSGSMREIIESTRLVTLQAFQNLKSEDEIAIITFAKKTSIVQVFTKDKSLISGQ
jgi:VWFA-related protein